MQWLIGSGYARWLDVITIILLGATLWGAGQFWCRQRRRGALACVTFVLMAVAFGLGWGRYERPVVYYDEFFYAATAENIARNGAVEPLYFQGIQAQEMRRGYPRPPYPVAWPHLVSLDLRLRTLIGDRSVETVPLWQRSVEVNRIVHVGTAAVLFLALYTQFGTIPAAAAIVLLLMTPAVQRLTQGGSAEGAALASLALTYWALTEWKQNCTWFGALWVILSAVWASHMRPETLLWSLLAVSWLLCDAHRNAPNLFKKIAISGVVVLVLGVLPGLAIMGCHPASANHHFEAIPRAQLDMMTNRCHNIINNALALVDNKIWPLGLTVLAAVGLWLGKRRERWLWLSAAVVMTLCLSWFPFGDYDCAYSLDSWRFTYHLVLPALIISAEGIKAVWERHKLVELVGCILAIAGVVIAGVLPNAFLNRVHPLERVNHMAAGVKQISGERLVVAESDEYHNLLRYGQGLPAILGLPMASVDQNGTKHIDDSSWPDDGIILFRVTDDLDIIPEEWGNINWELLDGDRQSQPAIGVYLLTKKWEREAERDDK